MQVEYWGQAADYLAEHGEFLSDLYFTMEGLVDGVPTEMIENRDGFYVWTTHGYN